MSRSNAVPGHPGTQRRPVWFSLEQPRALFELWQFMMATPYLRLAPRGVGRPVLVLPGFLSDDGATVNLRRYLREQGHAAYPWGLGVNLGPTEAILDGIERRLEQITALHGAPVSLIGVSLGGLFARDLAHRRQDSVRQVITLGSPCRMTPDSENSLKPLFDTLSPLHVAPSRFSVWDLPLGPLPVPTTVIYTRSDGIVGWETCLGGASALSENIEVVGSHSGLVHLPAAVYAIADRLAQPTDSWRGFAVPPALRWLYPTPERDANAL